MIRLGVAALVGLTAAVPLTKIESVTREAPFSHSPVLHGEAPISPSSLQRKKTAGAVLHQAKAAGVEAKVEKEIAQKVEQKVEELKKEKAAGAVLKQEKAGDQSAGVILDDPSAKKDCEGDCFGAFKPSKEYMACLQAIPDFPKETTKRAWMAGCSCHDEKYGNCKAFCDLENNEPIRVLVDDGNGAQEYKDTFVNTELKSDGDEQYPVIDQCVSGCQARGVCRASSHLNAATTSEPTAEPTPEPGATAEPTDVGATAEPTEAATVEPTPEVAKGL